MKCMVNQSLLMNDCNAVELKEFMFNPHKP